MKPRQAPIVCAAIAMPSITLCGSPSSTLRSMNAPGSPSSALQTTYFTSPAASRVNFHFRQVGKPAPPRPRSPETRSSFDHRLGVAFASSTLARAW